MPEGIAGGELPKIRRARLGVWEIMLIFSNPF